MNKRSEPLAVSFFKRNRLALLKKLPVGALAVIYPNKKYFHNGDSEYPYKQNTSFYYLTGLDLEQAVLVLARWEKADFTEMLFMTEASSFARTWLGMEHTFESVARVTGIATVLAWEEFPAQYHRHALRAQTLYFLLAEHPRGGKADSRGYDTANAENFRHLRQLYPLHSLGRLAPLVAELRLIKHAEEIARIERAIAVTIAMCRSAACLLQKGNVWEYEVLAEISRTLYQEGGEEMAFSPIIAGGERSTILHYTSNQKFLPAGQPLLLDLGASWGGYHGDLTRVWPSGWKSVRRPASSSNKLLFSKRLAAVYDAVVRVHDDVFSLIKPGRTFTEYQQGVRAAMERELAQLGLITATNPHKRRQQYQTYFMHGISHFLGLEVHDGMDLHDKNRSFQAGMVLTLEPGIYIKEEGIGVRLENDILVTEQGARNLSSSLPYHRDKLTTWLEQL